jgi:hypothetical protein
LTMGSRPFLLALRISCAALALVPAGAVTTSLQHNSGPPQHKKHGSCCQQGFKEASRWTGTRTHTALLRTAVSAPGARVVPEAHPAGNT